MRYGIVADIHANLAAFEAVLADMGQVDALWCLGDLVGYGPDPNECIELLRRHNHQCVIGNHDLAAIGRLDTTDFNATAAEAAGMDGSQSHRSIPTISGGLPEKVVVESFTLVHGSPRSPVWEYIFDESRAAVNFRSVRYPSMPGGPHARSRSLHPGSGQPQDHRQDTWPWG